MAVIKGYLSKEGKGVEKNTSEGKNAFGLFLEIYGRKFWKIIQVGLTYLIASIPSLIIVWFCAGLISSHVGNVVQPMLKQIIDDPGIVNSYVAIFDLLVRIYIALLFMAFWGTGPVSAGYTYILRNYAREEHAWPWSDFWEYTKSNFRQAIIVWFIDVIVFVLLIVAFFYYSTSNESLSILKYAVAFVFLCYTMMHIYIYQLMVTFKLKLKDIFKNAFLLAIAALPQNALCFALMVVIHGFFPYLGMNVPYFGGSMGYWTFYFIFAFFFLQGLSGFLMNFVANRTIKKYMLDKINVQDQKR